MRRAPASLSNIFRLGVKELWSLLSKAGVPRYAEIVCIADRPGEAAAMYYLLRLMGYPDVKVLASQL